MAKYFIIAGEASGEMHAAALMKQIKLRDPEAKFAGLGGDHMEAAECHLYQHIRHMAFMGFAAVIANRHQVRENFRIAETALLNEKPDVLILIDYPSFNLRIASFCRKHSPKTKIFYYIPPKVWAWKHFRIHQIARLCDEVLGIFPFEPAYYQKYGYTCRYVGHPTVEEVTNTPRPPLKGGETDGEKIIAILPGSRQSEIIHCLPRMLEAARRFPEYKIVVTAAPGINDEFYTPYLSARDTLTRNTYEAVVQASAAVVNSGTATLETALLGCPQVAVYHLALSGLIGFVRKIGQPLIFTIRHFTPVNIIAGREVIKECIANEFTVDNVAAELDRLLHDVAHQKELLAGYKQLSSLLGSQSASETAAHIITSYNLSNPVTAA